MKKKVLLSFILSILSLTALARQPQRGYRGFVEFGTTGFTERSLEQISANEFRERVAYTGYLGLSTSHGYQFNPYLYTGLGFDGTAASPGSIAALFADVRSDAKFGKFTPFADFRLGYNFTQGGGIYLAPAVGYRFNWGRKVGINLTAGLIVISRTSPIWQYEEHYFHPDDDPDSTYLGYAGWSIIGHERQGRIHFNFRIGIDF